MHFVVLPCRACDSHVARPGGLFLQHMSSSVASLRRGARASVASTDDVDVGLTLNFQRVEISGAPEFDSEKRQVGARGSPFSPPPPSSFPPVTVSLVYCPLSAVGLLAVAALVAVTLLHTCACIHMDALLCSSTP